MKKEEIRDKNQLLAVILRGGDFPEGLNFHTEDKDFVQLATWNYNKEKRSSSHSHNLVERRSNRTQEVIYIKQGMVKFNIYTAEDKFLKEVILNSGEMIIIFTGGHSMEILEDNTQGIEFKNGPYPGLEKDRRLIL